MTNRSQIPTCAPLRQVFAICRELHYPGVTVAVGHKEVPRFTVHSDVSGLTEVLVVAPRCESLSQCQQGSVSAITAHFQHLMSRVGNCCDIYYMKINLRIFFDCWICY